MHPQSIFILFTALLATLRTAEAQVRCKASRQSHPTDAAKSDYSKIAGVPGRQHP